MIRREFCGNHFAVIRGVVPTLCVFFDKRQQFPNLVVQRQPPGLVPEKLASVSPIPVVAMFNSEEAGHPLPASKNWSTLLVFPARH